MVIEDIKLINPGENVIGGFVPLDKCYDSSKNYLEIYIKITLNNKIYKLQQVKNAFKKKSYASKYRTDFSQQRPSAT